MNNNFKVKVAEAHQNDVNSGIIRVNRKIIGALGLNYGDIIGIAGENKTLAVVDKPYPSDLMLDIARMDGVIRKNAKVSVGEHIELFKPELIEAKKVVLSPVTEFNSNPASLSILKEELLRKPIVNGDIICIKPNNKKRLISRDNKFAIDIFSSIQDEFLGLNSNGNKFLVTVSKPSGFLFIGPNTNVEIVNKSEYETDLSEINFEDIGGLSEQLIKIRELAEFPFKHPKVFSRLGITAPKGILLYGPPGTGKTLLAKALAYETDANFFSISAPEIANKFLGESEKKLRELFESARSVGSAIIFIDEIDAIMSKRDDSNNDFDKRIVAQLLTLMDGLNKADGVVVIAATNRIDSLDEALRRPGRFDREIEIGVPKVDGRMEILKIHTRNMPIELPKQFSVYEKRLKEYNKNILKILKEKADDTKEDLGKIEEIDGVNGVDDGADCVVDLKVIKEDFKNDVFLGLSKIPEEILSEVRDENCDLMLEDIAKSTHGFVGADLEALVKEAAYNVLRTNFPDMAFDDEVPIDVLNKLEIKKEDFINALSVIRPSAMREFMVEVPDVKWSDIGGLDDLKQQLTEMIEWPIKNPEAFSRLGISSPKGILMYGPPGTGKTLLAKAVANESECNFIYIKGPELISKGIGDTEKTIRKIFLKARKSSPSILFFDEFDSIGGLRDGNTAMNFVNQILTEMDGLEDLVNVKVLAATNRPGLIDPALLRPGRFDKLVLVDIPNLEAREKILEVHLKNTPVSNLKKIVSSLAGQTEGYVGADLQAVVREAGLIALRRDINSKNIDDKDFENALDIVKPSVTEDVSKKYKEIEQELKRTSPEEEGLSMNSYI
ncbi:MAG: CDC48 family AAA ATPase [Nanoarchaeales archaeon]|nr:CDC48 family AAA ATPase [Nanoarchaeales archaeon]